MNLAARYKIVVDENNQLKGRILPRLQRLEHNVNLLLRWNDGKKRYKRKPGSLDTWIKEIFNANFNEGLPELSQEEVLTVEE